MSTAVLQQNQPTKASPALDNHRVADLYSSCIKLCSENKITQKNSWELNLIDYISDVLDSQNDGDMTNFQAASCTLDASIKIYSYRVDSVHTDTYKVLGGLSRSGGGSLDDDDDNQEKSENSENIKPKRHKTVNTLETNLASITLKQLDMEFDVDPLFTKTSASFDEGGAKGLLLNHLSVHNGCELIFDSSDAVDASTDSKKDNASNITFDIADLQTIVQAHGQRDISQLKICSAFANFEFCNWSPSKAMSSRNGGKDRFGNTNFIDDDDEEDENIDDAFSLDESAAKRGEKAFSFADELDDDSKYDLGGTYGDDDEEEDNSGASSSASGLQVLGSVFAQPSNEFKATAAAAITNVNVVLSSNNGNRVNGASLSDSPSSTISVSLSMGDEYGYFSAQSMKNWAGLDHWKMKSVAKDSSKITLSKKLKPKKDALFIDFSTSIDTNKAFAKSKVKTSTILGKAALEKMTATQTTLPDDAHYTEDKLHRLFLKPSLVVNWSNGVVMDKENELQATNNSNGRSEVEEDEDDYDGGYDDQNNTTLGFFTSSALDETTMFPAMSDNLIEQPRKVEKITINYAKTAKKVDVKKLKEAMWTKLDHLIPSEPSKTVSTTEKTMEVQSFANIFGELSAPFVTKEKPLSVDNNGLSIAICFVCLLHLANENNLSVASQMDMSDLIVKQN